MAEYFVT